jgi:hypothetical protein
MIRLERRQLVRPGPKLHPASRARERSGETRQQVCGHRLVVDPSVFLRPAIGGLLWNVNLCR